MLLDHYVSAMDSWKGRIDSDTDYDACLLYTSFPPTICSGARSTATAA